jgi:hypothetical protein
MNSPDGRTQDARNAGDYIRYLGAWLLNTEFNAWIEMALKFRVSSYCGCEVWRQHTFAGFGVGAGDHLQRCAPSRITH